MTITLNGTTGITAPSITNDGGYTGDGVSFADTTPANTLVTTTGGNVGIGTASPSNKLTVSGAGTALRLISSNTGVYVGLQTSDANGVYLGSVSNSMVFQTADTERGRFDSSGNFKFNSGYGSVATAYGCRAWVNFNGSGGGIRSSGNVTSITVSGTGRYTVNMTTALPDANYSRVVAASGLSGDGNGVCANSDLVSGNSVTPSTTQFGIYLTISGQSGYRDSPYVSAAVFR